MPNQILKNLHLGVSAFIILGMALIYGANPSKLLSIFFDIEVQSVALKNIFRAIMGLYLANASYWIYGILKEQHWRSATLANIIFMGGLAFGRIISLVVDGISIPFAKGLVIEFLFLAWGIYSLKKYPTLTKPS